VLVNQAQVYRVLYHLVGSREEAEDLAQETFMALYNQPPATGTGADCLAVPGHSEPGLQSKQQIEIH
jgi:Sigma-70 region 2